MLSVNTNAGALTALQYLTNTNSQLQTTQNAISSGLKVSSAKDNGAIYAIAQNMRGNVAGYSAVSDSLNRGISVVDAAMSAGTVGIRSSDSDETECAGGLRQLARRHEPHIPGQ